MACKVISSNDENSGVKMTFNAIYWINWNSASKVSLGSKEYIPSERLLLDWDGHFLLPQRTDNGKWSFFKLPTRSTVFHRPLPPLPRPHGYRHRITCLRCRGRGHARRLLCFQTTARVRSKPAPPPRRPRGQAT